MADQEPENDADTADDQPRIPVVGRAEADQGEQDERRREDEVDTDLRGRQPLPPAGQDLAWCGRRRERLPAFDGVAVIAPTPAAMTRRRSASSSR